MMNEDQVQVSGTASVEIEDTQNFQPNPSSLMKDPTFTLVELSREEMERVAAARSLSIKIDCKV
ncbi:hypothetical protein [Microvirga sp. BSC39]|uniref:hypothetical protein n=1 Tax=Microvirga sp. BSC39 TaxID=1549810 RepID=UPI0004E882C2|nr:hypothetical protein [Microvirga sp. BSC39]KFG69239.1 hypothetical protein JH26_13805 [Microvirga sp. BSC39]